MMKNDSCTLKIGPTFFLSLCKRHFHYWSQNERNPFFSSKRKEHHNGQKKREATLSLLLNFHKTAINNIVIGYKYTGGKDGPGVRAPPMWPGFESKPWHQMCSERSVLLKVLLLSHLLKNQHLVIPIGSGRYLQLS